MIKILFKNGRYAPIIICDHCGRRIDVANRGAVIHKSQEPSGEFLKYCAILDALHVHKGECHEIAELELGGKLETGWVELAHHVRFLVHNAGLSLSELQEIDDFEDECERP